ncbi:hypothetical protein PV761_06090 [Arthrobacter sp. CC3]
MAKKYRRNNRNRQNENASAASVVVTMAPLVYLVTYAILYSLR